MSRIFESGKQYSLADIFKGNTKVVIPDLQRDYCWGNVVGNKEILVTEFMSSLIDLFKFKKNEPFTLGMIYAYQLDNAGLKGHIYLCDGQQRITTLFLLLGMLNRRNCFKGAEVLRDSNDEAFLQYSIRESTLYFLNDLVSEFFLTNTDQPVADIKKQDWYFEDYNMDPSIMAMLEALRLIDEKLEEFASSTELIEFGNFIHTKLEMLYYDMGTRAQGEKTFVIINKTGEPLTATENLKPRYISQLTEHKKEASEFWENWENFFWMNRKGAGEQTNDTADMGLLEFLRWVALLNSTHQEFDAIRKGENFNLNQLSPTEIQSYFEIVKFLFKESDVMGQEANDWLAPTKMLQQIDWFILLPIIAYVKRFGNKNLRNIIRVKHFFSNLVTVGKVNSAIGEMLPLALKIIKELPSEDIADVIEMTGISETLLTAEERLKMTIYKGASNRTEIEDVFWKDQEHRVMEGEIINLLEWSGGDHFDFDLYKKFSVAFSYLFQGEMDQSELDLVRRVLMTRELTEYPCIFKGNTNYSFGWRFSDWRTLIDNNKAKFKDLLYELHDRNAEQINEYLEGILECARQELSVNETKYGELYEFIVNPEILEYCTQKIAQYDDDKGWILIKGERRHGDHAHLKTYNLYTQLVEDKTSFFQEKGILDFYHKDDTALTFNFRECQVTLNLSFASLQNDAYYYKLQLFHGDDQERIESEYKEIANKLNLEWTEDVTNGFCRYESQFLHEDDIRKLLYDTIEEIYKDKVS